MHLATREFDLIAKYFRRDKNTRRDVKLGIGDDGAVLAISADMDLVVTTDTMVAGVHFDESLSAKALGHKLIAVNLSDLAAMGAEPTWLSLALTLPEINEPWLAEFSEGLLRLTDYYHCSLIGGDVTRGPLTLTITAQGLVPTGRAIQRGGAQPGDRIYVSGTLGDARASLEIQNNAFTASEAYALYFQERLHFPSPRVSLGQALRGVASSAIDLSDGLDSDLRHILAASKMGARVNVETIPTSPQLSATLTDAHARASLQAFAGDDYELCFTVSESRRGSLETISKQLGIPVTCIGVVSKEPGLHYFYEDEPIQLNAQGFSHFGEQS